MNIFQKVEQAIENDFRALAVPIEQREKEVKAAIFADLVNGKAYLERIASKLVHHGLALEEGEEQMLATAHAILTKWADKLDADLAPKEEQA